MANTQKVQNKEKRVPKSEVRLHLTLSEEQIAAKPKILSTPYSVILGQAGTGKTLLACHIAMQLFVKREINKIIITRPTISTEDNGFLPGTESEKMEPWLVPLRSNFLKLIGLPQLKNMEASNDIEIVSLTHFRGRTFENAFCIVDEAQNLTKQQMLMAIGRLGKDSRMMFCGDENQIDLKYKNTSAMQYVDKLRSIPDHVSIIKLFENHRHPSVGVVLDLLYEGNA